MNQFLRLKPLFKFPGQSQNFQIKNWTGKIKASDDGVKKNLLGYLFGFGFRYLIPLVSSIEYTFFSLKIINKNIHKNILEILDQNRISIEVTFLYFSTNQLKM